MAEHLFCKQGVSVRFRLAPYLTARSVMLLLLSVLPLVGSVVCLALPSALAGRIGVFVSSFVFALSLVL